MLNQHRPAQIGLKQSFLKSSPQPCSHIVFISSILRFFTFQSLSLIQLCKIWRTISNLSSRSFRRILICSFGNKLDRMFRIVQLKNLNYQDGNGNHLHPGKLGSSTWYHSREIQWQLFWLGLQLDYSTRLTYAKARGKWRFIRQ